MDDCKTCKTLGWQHLIAELGKLALFVGGAITFAATGHVDLAFLAMGAGAGVTTSGVTNAARHLGAPKVAAALRGPLLVLALVGAAGFLAARTVAAHNSPSLSRAIGVQSARADAQLPGKVKP